MSQYPPGLTSSDVAPSHFLLNAPPDASAHTVTSERSIVAFVGLYSSTKSSWRRTSFKSRCVAQPALPVDEDDAELETLAIDDALDVVEALPAPPPPADDEEVDVAESAAGWN